MSYRIVQGGVCIYNLKRLRLGEIAAAGLDVTEIEPLDPGSKLLKMPNVIVTPHIAGGTRGASVKSMIFAMSNVERLQRGEAPLSSVLGYARDAPPEGAGSSKL
jgi:phosphoglycerate dehydrogenase-like enzyme